MTDWGWALLAGGVAYLIWCTVAGFWHGFGPHWPGIRADLMEIWRLWREERRFKKKFKATMRAKGRIPR